MMSSNDTYLYELRQVRYALEGHTLSFFLQQWVRGGAIVTVSDLKLRCWFK